MRIVLCLLWCGAAWAEDPCAYLDREAATRAEALTRTTDVQQRALLDGAIQAYRNQAVACREQEKVRAAELAAAEKKAAEQEARDRPALERLRKDPSALQLALSAPLCSLDDKRVRLKKAIAGAKKEARKSGGQTGDEEQLRLQIVLLDLDARKWTSALERSKLAPLPCNDPVRKLAACVEGKGCSEDQRLLAKLAREEMLQPSPAPRR